LRRLLLIWSAWGLASRLPSEDLVTSDGKPAFRVLDGVQSHTLQIFYLSLLWRAGATSLPEFSRYVRLSDAVLDDLRRRIVTGEPGRFEDYPVQLFQIVNQGVRHNRTPLFERKRIVKIDATLGEEIDYVRFYFDGLVGHVHIAPDRSVPEHYLDTCLRASPRVIVFTQEFEGSRVWANMQELARAVKRESIAVPNSLSPIAAGIRARWPTTSSPPLPTWRVKKQSAS
jgi:hypothetical protein